MKIDQRNQADINQKKAQMAYGGNAGDSLALMMRRNQPGLGVGTQNVK